MNSTFRRSAVLCAISAMLCLTLVGQRVGGGRGPSGVAISPDGTMLAWTSGTQLHVSKVADPADDKVVGAAGCSASSPVWSPDGAWLAYTSACENKEDKGQAQIYLWSKTSGGIAPTDACKGVIQTGRLVERRENLAFLFVENATRSAGALDAMKPWNGVVGEDGVEIQRVMGVDVGSGKYNWLTPAKLHVYEFAWAPDSREIAYIAANPPGENTWWIAKLYTETLPSIAACEGSEN